MVAVRVYRAGLTGSPPAPAVRVYRAGLTGTEYQTPRLRVYRAGLTGVEAVFVAPFAARTAGPGEPVTLTAALVGGGAPDSWTWRVLPGSAPVQLTGTGAARSFPCPSVMPPGAEVRLGVTATRGGVTSPEVAAVVTVLPQLHWVRDRTTGAWVGAVVAPA